MTDVDGSSAQPGLHMVRVGLVAAPELPRRVALDLVDRLPRLLDRNFGGRWHVELAEDPLLAGRAGVDDVLDAGRDARSAAGWDVAICLTDVPLRDGKRPLVAAVDRHDKVAVVNIPALGLTALGGRVRTMTVALLADIMEEALERGQQPKRRLSAGMVMRREVVMDGRPQVRYLAPAGTGHVRLLSGMVRANRPWRAFSGLSTAVVAAFGTGAYALLSPTIWQLSGELGWGRLVAIMVCAVVAMIVWLVVGHELWERADGNTTPKEAALYNSATSLTLAIAVACGYLALFVLLFAVSGLLIEGGVFQQNADNAAGIGAYASLAWLGAAIGTVAGGLGSKLDNADEFRYATYGHHQGRRRESGNSEA
ncbi:MAG: hypothetical protein JWM90_1377 [Thermoleophilia bacterium]|nr:hypothetical protein [Thermoleophilia bacterium]